MRQRNQLAVVMTATVGMALVSVQAWADEAVPAAAPVNTAAQPVQVRPVNQLDLLEIVVDGNTVLADDDIREVLNPFLGPEKTPQDVDNARDALQKLYKEQGFKNVTVVIPRQSGKDGTVIFRVIENRIHRLTISGSKYHSLTRIRQLAPSLKEGQVLDFSQVQKDIVNLNQQSDMLVSPDLKASPVPGTVDVDLVVTDKLPLHGLAEVNNRYSQGTSHQRAMVNLSYDNLWQRNHSASLFYQTAPQRTTDGKVTVGSYTARFAGKPYMLSASAMRSDSNVTTLGGADVIGKGRSYSLRLIWQLPASETQVRSLSFGLDYKNFSSLVRLDAGNLFTPIRYYPVSVGYSEFNRKDNSSLQLDANVTMALPHLGSSSTVIDQNRYGARKQMIYSRFSANYTHDLPKGASVMVKGTGQITDQPLISNEQLSAGGMDTVRGYLEAEAIGDYGVTSSVEVRGPSLPDLWASDKWLERLQEVRPFVFVDGASLHQHHVLSGSANRVELLSTGLGLSMNLYGHVRGLLDWGIPLQKGPTTGSGDSRILFRVWSTF